MCLLQPLPLGWAEHKHRFSGKIFYANAATGQTRWTCPTDAEAAAAARIAGKPCIEDAVKSGDLALVQDHLAADVSCVGLEYAE
jgi:hypothetical protein